MNNGYFVDKELYDNTEASFNDLTIRYERLEKVADERMSTILDIEKYCIDEKEDLISGCEVCEDILKMIDKLKEKIKKSSQCDISKDTRNSRQRIANRKLLKENRQLKKQLDYLRSEEYYNQLRFERDMLQNVVDNGEVSKENKQFIDMTHRNTELLEQQKEFIKYLEDEIKLQEEINDIVLATGFEEILQKYKEIIGDDKE